MGVASGGVDVDDLEGARRIDAEGEGLGAGETDGDGCREIVRVGGVTAEGEGDNDDDT